MSEKSKSEFQCPNCGWWPDESVEGALIHQTPERIWEWACMEFGIDALKWEETWKCPHCFTVWTFTNANC